MTYAHALRESTSRHEPARSVVFDDQMEDDLQRWQKEDQPDLHTAKRVVMLIETTIGHPKKGVGRPKRLAGLPGVWSRRITRHHRLYYRVVDGELRFISCWGHDMPMRVEHALREGT